MSLQTTLNTETGPPLPAPTLPLLAIPESPTNRDVENRLTIAG